MIYKTSKSGSMMPAYCLVVLILLLLPGQAMGSPLLFLSVIMLAILLLTATKVKGMSFVLLSIGACIPVVIGTDDNTKVFFATHFSWLIRTIYVCSLLMFLYYFLIGKKRKNDLPISALILVSIGVLLNGLRFGFDESVDWFFKILTIPIMFYIGYKGRENWDDIIRIMTIIFCGLAIYAILDMFLGIGPYMPMKEMIPVYEALFRTGSLFVNSLCLCGFALCYHTLLLIDYYRTGRFSTFLIIFSLFILLITGSRTSFVVVSIEWVLFIFYLSHDKNKGRIVGAMLAVAILLFSVLWFSFNDYMTLFFERFTETSEHRTSGYQTTYNILKNNPFGVGSTALNDAFDAYSSEGFIASLNTLDNTYLTFLATSGLLFFIPLLFYFIIPFNALSRTRINSEYKMVVMLFAPYCLCGMSFNIEAFVQLNIVYFLLAGHLYRIIQNESKNGLINNNCQLQHA